NRVLAFGGNDDFTAPDSTWAWDGTDWAERTNSNAPNRFGMAAAFDPRYPGNVVLFGGWLSFRGDNYFNDTQFWDGAKWNVRTALAPTPRAGGSMMFDSTLQSLVLFGGQTFGVNKFLNDTWRWSGTNWVRMGTRHSPPPAAYSALVYDTTNRAGVLFDG